MVKVKMMAGPAETVETRHALSLQNREDRQMYFHGKEIAFADLLLIKYTIVGSEKSKGLAPILK